MAGILGIGNQRFIALFSRFLAKPRRKEIDLTNENRVHRPKANARDSSKALLQI
jgi:hypothetical protein